MLFCFSLSLVQLSWPRGVWMLRDWHWQLSPESSTAQPSSNPSPSAAVLELLWGSWCSGLLIHIQKSLYKWYPLAVLLVAPTRLGIKQSWQQPGPTGGHPAGQVRAGALRDTGALPGCGFNTSPELSNHLSPVLNPPFVQKLGI